MNPVPEHYKQNNNYEPIQFGIVANKTSKMSIIRPWKAAREASATEIPHPRLFRKCHLHVDSTSSSPIVGSSAPPSPSHSIHHTGLAEQFHLRINITLIKASVIKSPPNKLLLSNIQHRSSWLKKSNPCHISHALEVKEKKRIRAWWHLSCQIGITSVVCCYFEMFIMNLSFFLSLWQKVHIKCQTTSLSLLLHASLFLRALTFHFISELCCHIKCAYKRRQGPWAFTLSRPNTKKMLTCQ